MDALSRAGYRVWYDVGIPWGYEWMNTIANHIEQAALCLIFHSAASNRSRHCRAEISEMLADEKHIVPVYLDNSPVERGLRMYLRQFQSVKFYEYETTVDFLRDIANQTIFAPCKADTMPSISAETLSSLLEWRKSGGILWMFRDDVLTILRGTSGVIPNYWNEYAKITIMPWKYFRELITTVIITKGITEIGNSAFCNCNNLVSVNIPDSIITIGDSAFYRCNSLTSISLSNGIKTIGDYAFYRCNNLINITIPDSVIKIGDFTFFYCTSLETISIPSKVELGKNAFDPHTQVIRRK